MPDVVTIRALRVLAGDQISDEALTAMIGHQVKPSGTVVAARVVDGWLELDIEGVKIGMSVVTSLSTGEQHIEPPARPIEPTSWFPTLPMSSLAVTLAARAEQAVTYGSAAGLTQGEAREVIAAWAEHHQARFDALDWPTVESAMAKRAMGLQWRPE